MATGCSIPSSPLRSKCSRPSLLTHRPNMRQPGSKAPSKSAPLKAVRQISARPAPGKSLLMQSVHALVRKGRNRALWSCPGVARCLLLPTSPFSIDMSLGTDKVLRHLLDCYCVSAHASTTSKPLVGLSGYGNAFVTEET